MTAKLELFDKPKQSVIEAPVKQTHIHTDCFDDRDIEISRIFFSDFLVNSSCSIVLFTGEKHLHGENSVIFTFFRWNSS